MVNESPMGRFWEFTLERATQLDNDWKVVGAEGRKGASLRIQGYVGGGYCDVEWGGGPYETGRGSENQC